MKKYLPVIALAVASCGAPLTIDSFRPAPGFVPKDQAYLECRAEVMRDLHNSASPMSVAFFAKTRMTECMEGRGYARN